MMKTPLTLLIVVALAGSACTQAEDSRRAAPAQADLSRLEDDVTPGFLSHMRATQYDYEPSDRPSELARRVESVVTGTIIDVKRGQSYAPTPNSEAAIATSVLEVKVDRVIRGSRAIVFDGSIYVEVFHPAFVGSGPRTVEGSTEQAPFDHSAYAETVPRAYGVFFLEDRTQEPPWPTILDEGAGRPEGARITQTFVQGFLIEDSEGRLTSVMEAFEAMPPAWHELDSVSEVLSQL